MRSARLLHVFLAVFATWSLVEIRPQSQVKTLAIEHVTIIDATGAPAMPDMTVVVVGNRIANVGQSRALRPRVGAQVLDGTGKFLIPGLWDMHVHLGGYDSGKKALGPLGLWVIATGIYATPITISTAC
jgi:hypothetical protein